MRHFIILLLLLLAAPASRAEEPAAPVANATLTPRPSAQAPPGGTRPLATEPLPPAAPVGARETRDPFIDPYKYAQAIQQVVVMGIVIADKVERVIVQIHGYDELAVFKGGDTIAVNFQGLPHEFKITEVKPRSVSFIAGPRQTKKGADPETFTYEVFLL